MNEEIKIKPADPSTLEKPGYKFESMFTANDLSYTVHVSFVDLATVVSGINLHSYSKSDTLIKYSKPRFSPVSQEPADCIQLATPSYYHEGGPENNSEFIADNLEGRHIERLNWRSRGSRAMETFKQNSSALLPGLRYNLKAEMTRERNDFWMYCTSIDPNTSYGRNKQVKHLFPDYSFMTGIENPSEFAKQLGRNVAKQIELDEDLKCDNSSLHILTSFSRRESEFMGNFLIYVNHGPVIYLDDDKIERLLSNPPGENGGSIVPFVKRKKYKEQQEYRFLVSVQFHSPNKDTFNLKVSDEFRNLMAPIESI